MPSRSLPVGDAAFTGRWGDFPATRLDACRAAPVEESTLRFWSHGNHVQVQRASGAYIMSARKQATGLTPLPSQNSLAEPLSPLPMADLNSHTADFDAAASERASSLAEDEEFAAEEHAHRCVQRAREPT